MVDCRRNSSGIGRMPNVNRNQRRTIAQLDFEQRILLAELDYGHLDEGAAQDLVRRIEDLDLAIAATPAADISELGIKFDRLPTLIKFPAALQVVKIIWATAFRRRRIVSGVDILEICMRHGRSG